MQESGFEVQIERNAPTRLYPFSRYFRGFQHVGAVRELFGKDTAELLRTLKVEFFSSKFGYMGTSDVDGHLIVSTHYLETGEFRTIYLDIVHELCHVKQFRDGRPLFRPDLSYVDTPTEVEAYAFTVKEGRRIGMTDVELVDYLKVEWIDAKDHRRLARRLGLLRRARPGATKRSRRRK
jgi:hypothetical protein